MSNKGILLLSLCLTTSMLSSCGVSVDQIHKWGANGQYDRIRAALSNQPAENIRIAAATALGKGDYLFGIPDLVNLSHDANYKVRAAAVNALGQYAGTEVYNAVIQRTGDENAEVARAAEQVLRTWNEDSTPFLIEAAEDRNYKVRAAAITILGRMNAKEIPAILQAHAQRDDNNVVRREAVRAIGNKGLKEARALLHKIKNSDSSSEVSMAAADALDKIGGNILDVTVLVVPFYTNDDFTDQQITPLGNYLCQQLVQNRLCDVRNTTKMVGNNLQQELLEIGKAENAQQVIGGTISHSQGKLSIDLQRLDVTKGTLIQQESYSGLESQPDQVIKELTKRLISRFI